MNFLQKQNFMRQYILAQQPFGEIMDLYRQQVLLIANNSTGQGGPVNYNAPIG